MPAIRLFSDEDLHEHLSCYEQEPTADNEEHLACLFEEPGEFERRTRSLRRRRGSPKVRKSLTFLRFEEENP